MKEAAPTKKVEAKVEVKTASFAEKRKFVEDLNERFSDVSDGQLTAKLEMITEGAWSPDEAEKKAVINEAKRRGLFMPIHATSLEALQKHNSEIDHKPLAVELGEYLKTHTPTLSGVNTPSHKTELKPFAERLKISLDNLKASALNLGKLDHKGRRVGLAAMASLFMAMPVSKAFAGDRDTQNLNQPPAATASADDVASVLASGLRNGQKMKLSEAKRVEGDKEFVTTTIGGKVVSMSLDQYQKQFGKTIEKKDSGTGAEVKLADLDTSKVIHGDNGVTVKVGDVQKAFEAQKAKAASERAVASRNVGNSLDVSHGSMGQDTHNKTADLQAKLEAKGVMEEKVFNSDEAIKTLVKKEGKDAHFYTPSQVGSQSKYWTSGSGEIIKSQADYDRHIQDLRNEGYTGTQVNPSNFGFKLEKNEFITTLKYDTMVKAQVVMGSGYVLLKAGTKVVFERHAGTSPDGKPCNVLKYIEACHNPIDANDPRTNVDGSGGFVL